MSESKYEDRASLFAAKNDVRLEIEALFSQQPGRVIAHKHFRGKKAESHFQAWAVCSLPSGMAYKVDFTQKKDDDRQVYEYAIDLRALTLERSSERSNRVIESERIFIHGGILTVPFIEGEYRDINAPIHKQPKVVSYHYDLTIEQLTLLAEELSASNFLEPSAAKQLLTPEVLVPNVRQLNKLFGISISKDFLQKED